MNIIQIKVNKITNNNLIINFKQPTKPHLLQI